MSSSTSSKVSLYSESCARGNYVITGELRISISYSKGQLRVVLHYARGLAAADSNGFSDPYVKIYLLPDKSKHSKRKTDVKKKTLAPVYNETLLVSLWQFLMGTLLLTFLRTYCITGEMSRSGVLSLLCCSCDVVHVVLQCDLVLQCCSVMLCCSVWCCVLQCVVVLQYAVLLFK